MSDEELPSSFRRGRISIIDSDEEEMVEGINNTVDNENDVNHNRGKSNTVLTAKNDFRMETIGRVVKTIDIDLYDAEDSDDAVERTESVGSPTVMPPNLFGDNGETEFDVKESRDQIKQMVKNSTKVKKKQKHNKDALLEITSETQRFVREGRIRLPYHQPKQRSLTEFLERRKSLLPISINASADQLKQACKRLKSLEKEVELFYTAPELENKINSENVIDDSSVSTIIKNVEPLLQTFSPITEQSNDANDINCKDDDDEKGTATEVETFDPKVDIDVLKDPAYNDDQLDFNMDTDFAENVDIGCFRNSVIINEADQTEVVNKNEASDIQADSCEQQSTGLSRDTVIFVASGNSMLEEQRINIEEVELAKINENSTIICDVNTNLKEMDDSENEYRMLRDRYRMLIDADELVFEAGIDYQIDDFVDDTVTDCREDDDAFITNIDEITVECIHLLKRMMEKLQKLASEDNEINKNTSNGNRKSRNTCCRIRKLPDNFILPEIKLYDNDSVIEIEYDVPTVFSAEKSAGVISLMEKFIKHTTVKPASDKKKSRQISVVNTEKDTHNEIVNVSKETIVLDNDVDVDEYNLLLPTNGKLSKPGSRYSLLKTKLRKQVVDEKEANWNKYQNEKQLLYEPLIEEDDVEDDEYESDDKKLDDPKLEFTPAYLMDDVKDEDLEEDDMPMVDREIAKNTYVDDEAEESDDELDENYDADEDSDGVGNEDDNDVDGNDVNGNEDDNDADDSRIHDDEEEKTNGDDCNNSEIDKNKQQEIKDENNDYKSSVNSVTSTDRDSEKPFFSIFQAKKLPEKSKQTAIDKINEKLFERNTTGTELENKVMGLDDIFSQPQDNFTESQLMGVCSASFSTQKFSTGNINRSFDSLGDESFSLSYPSDSEKQNGGDSLSIDAQSEIDKARNSSASSKNSVTYESDNEELFTKRRKPQKNFILSDDESERENETEEGQDAEDDDEIVEDGIENETDDTENVDEEDAAEDEEVFYDSDEEVVTEKAQQFFENEAELSESEWGSEDENEKGLDEFEKELGDEDEIDADELKEELGKMHMRQMLDDDQKDIRMLKEMLLEDGELHSDSKRNRKFQWKNMTDGSEFVSASFYDSDDENHADDDDNEETEEQWRKLRHERGMFLSQHESDDTIDEMYNSNSQLSKLGKSVLRSIQCNRVMEPTEITGEIPTTLSPSAKQLLKPKCGSFLSRGELMLSRIGLTMNDGETSINKPKNGRNFLFSSVSPGKDKYKNDDQAEDNYDAKTPEKVKKRKSIPISSANVKKPKLSAVTAVHNEGIRVPDIANQKRSLLHMMLDNI